nr:hypothetical protein [Lacticaseibacillus manihotivorans]
MSDFAGIVALGKFSTAQLEVLKQSGKPLVIVDQDVLGEGVSCVVPDFANGIDRIIHYMQAAGYQTVGMIAGVEETSDGQALNDPRRQLFPQLAVDAGFSTPAIYAAPFTVEGGYQPWKSQLQQENCQTRSLLPMIPWLSGRLKLCKMRTLIFLMTSAFLVSTILPLACISIQL